MKAILVKNDNLETIGLQIKDGDITLFSWGISGVGIYWQKEIFVEPRLLCELVSLSAKLETQNRFHKQFFEVAYDNGLEDKCATGICFKIADEKANEIEASIKGLIYKLV